MLKESQELLNKIRQETNEDKQLDIACEMNDWIWDQRFNLVNDLMIHFPIEEFPPVIGLGLFMWTYCMSELIPSRQEFREKVYQHYINTQGKEKADKVFENLN